MCFLLGAVVEAISSTVIGRPVGLVAMLTFGDVARHARPADMTNIRFDRRHPRYAHTEAPVAEPYEYSSRTPLLPVLHEAGCTTAPGCRASRTRGLTVRCWTGRVRAFDHAFHTGSGFFGYPLQAV